MNEIVDNLEDRWLWKAYWRKQDHCRIFWLRENTISLLENGIQQQINPTCISISINVYFFRKFANFKNDIKSLSRLRMCNYLERVERITLTMNLRDTSEYVYPFCKHIRRGISRVNLTVSLLSPSALVLVRLRSLVFNYCGKENILLQEEMSGRNYYLWTLRKVPFWLHWWLRNLYVLTL